MLDFLKDHMDPKNIITAELKITPWSTDKALTFNTRAGWFVSGRRLKVRIYQSNLLNGQRLAVIAIGTHACILHVLDTAERH